MDSRDAQRQLLREFIIWQYAHQHPQDGLEEFLDGHGVEYRERIAQAVNELTPVVGILSNSGLFHRAAVDGMINRTQTALRLLKGE